MGRKRRLVGWVGWIGWSGQLRGNRSIIPRSEVFCMLRVRSEMWQSCELTGSCSCLPAGEFLSELLQSKLENLFWYSSCLLGAARDSSKKK